MVVFLHIPKTAGSTFQFILENSFGVSACHTNHARKPVFEQNDVNFVLRVFPRLKSIAGHNLVDPARLDIPNPFFMTFLRHPVDRVLSQYQNLVNHGRQFRTFEETLRRCDPLQNLQVKLLAGEPSLDKAKRFLDICNFVGLTERFDLSLHALDRLSPYRLNLNYKRRRSARDNSIKQALKSDSRVVDMIRHYNHKDIQLYAYGVEEVFPRSCRRAGASPVEHPPSYDRYASEVRPKYLLSHLYNMVFYRQACKLRRAADRRRGRTGA